MNAMQTNETVKTVVKSVIIGGLALTAVAGTGCDRPSQAQVAELASMPALQADESLAIVGKLAANHNETFLT